MHKALGSIPSNEEIKSAVASFESLWGGTCYSAQSKKTSTLKKVLESLPEDWGPSVVVYTWGPEFSLQHASPLLCPPPAPHSLQKKKKVSQTQRNQVIKEERWRSQLGSLELEAGPKVFQIQVKKNQQFICFLLGILMEMFLCFAESTPHMDLWRLWRDSLSTPCLWDSLC
jgi:hypothetical protein